MGYCRSIRWSTEWQLPVFNPRSNDLIQFVWKVEKIVPLHWVFPKCPSKFRLAFDFVFRISEGETWLTDWQRERQREVGLSFWMLKEMKEKDQTNSFSSVCFFTKQRQCCLQLPSQTVKQSNSQTVDKCFGTISPYLRIFLEWLPSYFRATLEQL